MLVLRGSLAYSHFRLERLLSQINYLVPQVSGLYAEYIHLVDFQEVQNEEENQRLTQLLNYEGYSTEPIPQTPVGTLLLVAPSARGGSQWSLTATEIVQLCGLYKIRRIERAIGYIVKSTEKLTWGDIQAIAGLLHDPETETVYYHLADAEAIFKNVEPRSAAVIDIQEKGKSALFKETEHLDLDFLEKESNHIVEVFKTLNRNPSDVELKILLAFNLKSHVDALFNVQWVTEDGKKIPSLQALIKKTQQLAAPALFSGCPERSPIIEGGRSGYFCRETGSGTYRYHPESIAIVLAGGSIASSFSFEMGNEISYTLAAGRGARAKAGYCGYSVSNLQIPNFTHAWEVDTMKSKSSPSALEIMLEVPTLYANLNNTFGRPTINGYFRTYEQVFAKSSPKPKTSDSEVNEDAEEALVGSVEVCGYFTPLVIMGGLGNLRQLHSHKPKIMPGMAVVYLGSPISFATSSRRNTSEREMLPAAKNPEMQRRCQETINGCMEMGIENPIVALYVVGRLGLANSVVELLKGHFVGARFELRDIPVADHALSPLEIWGSSSEDGYLLVMAENNIRSFNEIAERENCPFAIVGQILEKLEVQLFDRKSQGYVVNLPLNLIQTSAVRERKVFLPTARHTTPIKIAKLNLENVIFRLLKFPCIADKSFLITLCDRTATGLVARDSLVGPWQVPVADCGVMARGYDTYIGEAIALGERPALSLIKPVSAARMAVGEALTNIVAANIQNLNDVRLAVHWVGVFEQPEEEAELFDIVRAVAAELCPTLGVSIALSDNGVIHKNALQKNLRNSQNAQPKLPLSVVVTDIGPGNST